MSLSEWSNSIRGNSHHHDDDNDDEEDDESEKGILAPRMGHGYTQSSPSPKGPIGLGYSYQTPCRRSVGSSSSPKCSSCGSVRSSDDFLLHDDRPSPGLELPSRLFSTPSAASSLGLASAIMSPLRRELSRSRLHDNESGRPQSVPPSPGLAKITLARRLSQLAQQLTEGDDVDESALTTQVDQLEKAMRSPSPPRKAFQTPQRAHRSFSPRASHGGGGGDHHHHHRAPSSLHSTPASSLHRSRLSDFSASLMAKVREAEAEPEPTTTQQQLAKPAMNIEEANQVIAEASKLNEELTRVVGNLRARQEESDHIQELLIERAERAAQRILFLQNRISNLEYELKENDDEVQHLRICLKAVEIQLPSRSRLDPELQRCLTTFKKDYKDLKTKRAANRMSTSSLDGVHLDIMSSPLR